MGFVDTVKGWFGGSSRPRSLPPGPPVHRGAMINASSSPANMAQLALSELKFAPRTLFPAAWSLTPQWSQYSIDHAIERHWKGSSWAYICTMLNAQALASVPWLAYRSRGGRRVKAPDSPLQRLLDRPNPYWSQRDLVLRIALELQIAGNSIVSKVRAEPDKPAANIFTVRPQLVAPIPSRDLHVAGFSVVAADGRRFFLGARDAVHVQLPDPANAYWGMSPMQAAYRAIDTDRKAADWQAASLDNMMVPPGAFVVDGTLTDPEFEKAQEQIGKHYAGAIHARTPLVLSGAKWLPLSMAPADLDWLDGRKLTREEICAVFRVPPPVAGILERATYDNIHTARAIWWEDGILPLAGMISDTLTVGLAREFGDDFVIAPDTSRVPALLAALAERIKSARELFAMGVAPNAAFEFLGLDLVVAGGNVGYLPSTLVPITPEGQVDPADMFRFDDVQPPPLPRQASRRAKRDAKDFRRWLDGQTAGLELGA